MQKIKTELFDNKFYTVKGVNQIISNISFIDFTTSPPISSIGLSNSPMSIGLSNSPMSTISPNIYQKTIQLHKLDIPISIDKFSNIGDLQETHILYNNIKNAINKEYFKIITELGEKNRVDSPVDRLDIFIDKLKKDYPKSGELGRNIYSKFMSSSNYIATNGRIGPGQWLVSNTKTYKYIINYLNMELMYDADSNLLIGNMPYVVNDLIDDDIILMGKKNNISQPGVNCVILTDDDGYIITQEYISSTGYSKILSVFFSIDDIGLNPEHQFFKINTRSLTYYRCKKLKRIKELYGL